MLAGLREFREHLGGELTVTLLRDIGAGIEVNEIDPDAVVRSLAWLEARQ
jgi:3-dehydroquinate synthase